MLSCLVALQDQLAAALPSYELGEELGRGSTGVVLSAEHRQLGRGVAVKVLPPDLADDVVVRRRFIDEARLLASFSHSHIVPIYDFVEYEGLCILVMERLGGGTLHDYARAGVDGPAACAAILALCSGLHYAHERGVLHRDVKPANVLIAEDGMVKVTDFGIAQVLGGSETVITRAGFVLGTPAYMAPEQAAGAETSPATDVYGAATVLYQLLSGRLPFPADRAPLQVLYARMHNDPRPLQEVAPDVPPELGDVVMRALEREPARRYRSAEGMRSDLAAAAASVWGRGWITATPFAAGLAGAGRAPERTVISGQPLAPPALAEPPAPPPEPPQRRSRLAVVGAALASLAAIGVAVALLAGGGGGDDSGAAEAPPAPPLDPSGWQPLRPALFEQQQMATTVLGNTAWLFGGLVGRGADPKATRRVQIFDTAIGNWTRGPQLPVPLNHAMAVVYKGNPVVIGGWIAKGSNLTDETSARVYELAGEKWRRLPSLKNPRAAGAAAVVDGQIVVVGGLGDDGPVDATEVFDGQSWEERARIPTPREHLGAASDGRYVYAVGGRDATSTDVALLERYDPAADDWTTLRPMQVARDGLGAAVTAGRLFAVGGERPTGVLDTVEAYDIRRGRWTTMKPLPRPRHGMAVVAARGRLFALVGALGRAHTDSTDVGDALSLNPR
jgi:non-specific serine/threonine protein kinase